MLKLLTFPGVDDEGNVFVQALNPSDELVKTAECGSLHPDISSYVGGIKPCDKNLYVLVNALGAGEYYGSNINGDYFEEKELDPTDTTGSGGYRTFFDAGIYRHHKNKDISKSTGKVVHAVYNPIMHRVELILRIDRQKASLEGHEDLVSRLDSGEHPAVSMGCRVKYDICSICGHKSKTRADYCSHTRTMMGKVFPDGRKVFVYNPSPRFFDLSFVVIGADRTSYAMAKVASVMGGSSALAAEEAGIRDGYNVKILKEKMAAKSKISRMLKEVPAMSAKVMPSISRHEPSISRGILDRMGGCPAHKALTTASSAGIVLKPHEYQRIILIRIGKRPLADRLDHAGRVFEPSMNVDRSINLGRPEHFSHPIRDLLMNIISKRSMFDPVITKRITIIRSARPSTEHSSPSILHKESSVKSIDISPDEEILLERISAGYNGYREQLMEKISSIVAHITSNDIGLLSAINSQGLEDEFLMGTSLEKTAKLPLALVGVLPMAYLYGAHVRKKRRFGVSNGPLDKFIEKHPILATSVFVGLTRMGMSLRSSGVFDKSLNDLAVKFS
ncbi:MAG: hypothetical protein CL582_21905 [Alteromonadaceae bacterium]|nr:hypothetical protein [Alteromonadaceae bacterium]|tara:strand:+ start:223 stop:1902 length:1680 start_codon:yes stop_codon:yes gene_type:complete